MRVFLSWSGERSKAVALALREWLPQVLQALEPWMSENDIKAGQQWAREIGNQLDATSFGIICVTPENQSASWLNFEAGALSKRIEGGEARVAGYLLGVTPGGVEGPLSLYQHKEATKSGTLDLLKSLNSALEKPLTERQLERAFERWWPELEQKVGAIPAAKPGTPHPPRDTNTMLEEVVETVRRIEKNQQRPGRTLAEFPTTTAEGGELPPWTYISLLDLLKGQPTELLTQKVADALRNRLVHDTNPPKPETTKKKKQK